MSQTHQKGVGDLGLKEGFLSSALHVPLPRGHLSRKPCLAGLSSSVPGSPAAAKRWTDGAQVPGARGEAGEEAVPTDHFLEPPECTPGLRPSRRRCCAVRPAAGCGPPPARSGVGALSVPPAAALPRPGGPGTSRPGAASIQPAGRVGRPGGPALGMLQTPPPGGLQQRQEGGCGEPGGQAAVPGTEGSCGILCDPRQPVRKGGPAARGGPAAPVWPSDAKDSVSRRSSRSQRNETTEGATGR